MATQADQILQQGQTVETEPSGLTCVVETMLGAGTQGQVYRVVVAGSPFALKWYLPASATSKQRAALHVLIRSGAPNDRFLWPMEVASAPGAEGFGYLMRLRDGRYKGFADLMTRRAEPTFRALATACLELAHSYLQLHNKGLCYRDISFGNVFFDPQTGDVLICDNDNVTVNGTTDAAVAGTQRFMAPEVVRGEACPSTQTDLFSLAVLLFYMLMVHHPLEGKKELAIKCLDAPAMNKLYGSDPLFIFDPRNLSNAPVPGYHDNAIAFWAIYPQFLRDLFTVSFTDGIRDPQNGRIRESQWRAAMVRLRDAIIYCSGCGVENFYDADALRAAQTTHCWACQQKPQLPPRIRIGKDVIVALNKDTRLYPHHVDGAKPYDFSRPVAEVTRHPRDPGIWGLKNLSDGKWVCTTGNGANREVERGRSVALASGTKIDFGTAQGEIRL
jgi:DNA-binding helix-hairpin-helix protein with protein kinase domain